MNMLLSSRWRSCMGALALILAAPAFGALTDLATAPLETSSATLVKPNIMFILDNSGSMSSAYLPDWADDYSASSYPYLYRNSRFNGIYYDPSVTYTPPVNYAGTSYTSMTSANTSAWTKVPTDGFGIISTGTTDLTGTSTPATHYTFIPGEYCSSANLRTCNKQSAATTAYAYPAYLRWCTTSALSTCQAVYIDSTSAPATYKYPRYAGMSSTATIVISGSSSTSISGITVNGVQILSATTSASTSSTTVATNIVTAINNCTSSKTGNCGIAGYSASRSGSTVTITSPKGTDAYGYSPVVTQSGSMTATVTAFSGGTPGSWVQTTISSSTSTYAYPGTSARSTTRTDCTTNSTTCTYAEEMTNFANWWAYYHTRMQAMKSATTLAFSGLTSSYRLGYMTINKVSSSTDFLNIADNTTTSGGQKSLWYGKLLAAQASGTTPLRTALSNAGRYYAAKISSINGVTTTDPMQYACQRNYTLLSTDGYWNETATPYKVDGSTAVGDQDSSESRPYLDGNAVSNTLADTAEYYYTTDLRSSSLSNATNSSGTDVSSNSYSNKRQNMVTSTIGLGASGYMLFDADYANATSGDYYDVANGTTTSSTTQASGVCIWQSSGSCNWPTPVSNTQTAIDDLWHTAVNGRGSYYSASNAADIKTSLTNFLNTVDATTSSSAAVTQSAAVLTSTTTGYTFSTTYCSGKWFGELARYAVNSSTGVTSSTADWAESGAGSDCSSTSGSLTTTALLDNIGYASRTIFTYDASTATKLSFAWDSLTTTMQGYFKIASISSLSQLCSSGTSCLATASQVDSSTAGTTTGAGALNLVNYLRGDRSNEGSTNTKYYRSRTHVLGDVVNSTPVYIKAPSRSYSDSGYASFKSSNASRQGMVYVGANDGMLHAFNADTGAETWAYIPSVLLPNMYKLADKNYASNHVYFVDGQITQADVYYNSAWHTIIVGGLGDGGRAYFALDVTDPSSPTVLWEFSSSSTLTPNLYDTDLGYTYGAPIITKLSDGTWAVVLSSGYNNVSDGDGKGHLWIRNAMTGALIKKIDNGMGSNASGSTVTGCSVVPCPSGLAKISGWTNSSTDNTTTQVYGGDLYGNLWRFDISALTASSGSATVQLLATLSDSSGTRQPITTAPELGLVNSQHVVFVGTGAYLGVTDITTSQVQSMYAIKDTLSGSSSTTAIYSNPRSNACSSSTVTNCFIKLTLTDSSGVRTASSSVSYSTNFSTMYGWFVDMPESGERVDEDPVLSSGTLVYVSNTPSTSGACSTGGSSYINYVNYATGLAVSGADNAGVLLSSAGLSSSAALAITTSGKTVATTKDSTGAVTTTTIPTSSSSSTRRISWRRLSDGK